MIDVSQIQASLSTVIGWNQRLDSSTPAVNSTNKTSDSGIYVDSIEPICNSKNISRIFSGLAKDSSKLNDKLSEMKSNAMAKVFNLIFNKSSIIKNDPLYYFEQDTEDPLDNDTSFVGFEIDMAKRKDLRVQINTIDLHFDGVDSVKLMLFHSTKNDPIKTVTVSTLENETKSTAVNWVLNNYGQYKGGKYYIGYLRSGLTAKAYNREDNILTPFYTFRPTPIKVDNHNNETLFNVEEIDYKGETFGINMDVTEAWDYTDLIIQNKNRFAYVIAYQVAADFLNAVVASDQSNRDERISREMAMLQLNGNYNNDSLPNVIGIYKKLNTEIENIRKEFFGRPEIRNVNLC